MSPPLLLVDPPRGPFWPLAATRPVADLMAGTRTFRARWESRYGPLDGLLCDPEVADAAFRSGPPPPRNGWPAADTGYCIAVSAWVPQHGWTFGDEPAVHSRGGTPVAWRLDPDQAQALAAGPPSAERARRSLADLDLPVVDAGGLLPASIWEVVERNAALLEADVADFPGRFTEMGTDVAVLGDPPRAVSEVEIGAFAVLDTRAGPILLDRGASVGSHAVLVGPLYVGPGSTVLGGQVGDGTSIGPVCKVRGEVERTIFQGFSNKAHDGFVGHSAIGEWVNLGAGTVTSDLKNTYGPVRVDGPEGRQDTGLLKVGAFLGDHAKTGIGTLLTTGARIGAGSHLFGGRAVSPAWLPDFSWYDGTEWRPVRFDAFRRTATSAMARRAQRLGAGEEAILEALAACSASRPDANFTA